MALTRKFLAALGIEADKVDEIITAHGETVNALKTERDNYKIEADKLPDIQKELDDLKKTSAGNDEYKTKYDALKTEFDTYKSNQAAAATKLAKEDAYKNLLQKVGISEKRVSSVLKVSDVSSIELDKDGNIKNADKIEESLKTEWADFIESTRTEGAKTPYATGGATPGGEQKSRAAMIAAEYHNGLYGEAKQ